MQGGLQRHTGSVGIRSYFTQRDVCRKMGKMYGRKMGQSIRSAVVFFCRGDTQFTYCFNE